MMVMKINNMAGARSLNGLAVRLMLNIVLLGGNKGFD